MQVQLLEVVNRTAGRYIFGGSNLTEMPLRWKTENCCTTGLTLTPAIRERQHICGFGRGNVVRRRAGKDNTAFDISYPGVRLLGHGVDEDGISNNLYNIMSDLVAMLNNNDISQIDKYQADLNRLSAAYWCNTRISAKCNFVNFLDKRLLVDEGKLS